MGSTRNFHMLPGCLVARLSGCRAAGFPSFKVVPRKKLSNLIVIHTLPDFLTASQPKNETQLLFYPKRCHLISDYVVIALLG